jgi:hypothetical protein
LALHELHDDVEVAGEFADLVHSADVRLAQRGSRPRLVEHQFPSRLFHAGTLCHHLQGHVAMQHLVMGPIHYAHASFSDLGKDAMVPQQLPDHVLVFLAAEIS